MIHYDGKVGNVLVGVFMYFNIKAFRIEQKSNYKRKKKRLKTSKCTHYNIFTLIYFFHDTKNLTFIPM